MTAVAQHPSRAGAAVVVAVVVGVAGTWRSAGAVSSNGLEGPHDGWLVLLLALAALAGTRSLARRGWVGAVLVVGCGAGIVYASVRNLVDDGQVLGGRSGWGIWLTIAAGALLAALPVMIRGSTRARSTASP